MTDTTQAADATDVATSTSLQTNPANPTDIEHKPHEELRVLIEDANALADFYVPGGHDFLQHLLVLHLQVDADRHPHALRLPLLPEERWRQVRGDRQANGLQPSLALSTLACSCRPGRWRRQW